ncbi:hypothetical protein SAMN04487950_2565 [Halogranum rubrum]|uniref:Uncharacterized protein n=1 Tax=Halogranum rubrum TaxID=553466 RepID=A0A1I4F305_9EURY|nr:hypothetical protein [Halogranum rubrum]SFL11833.1 hypothetical protein SAMN04487950_2565 [Halogranum rubrum]
MGLISVSCPACGASTYLSLPTGRRFVTAEPGEGDDGREDLSEATATCDACETSFPVIHGPAREP